MRPRLRGHGDLPIEGNTVMMANYRLQFQTSLPSPFCRNPDVLRLQAVLVPMDRETRYDNADPTGNPLRMASSTDLHIASYCMASPLAPPDSRASLPTRLDAIARAGFAGTSLDWDEVQTIRREEGDLKGLRRRLSDAKLVASQMDYLGLPGDDPGFSDVARDIAHCSAELGCGVIHVLAMDRAASFETVLDHFGTLALSCRAAGVKCAIECVPAVTGIEDVPSALRLVRGVATLGTGLVIDSLHFYRVGAPWGDLDLIAPGEVLTVQVNDGPLGPPGPDFVEEALGNRLLPGDGAFDLRRFVRRLAAIAPEVPLTAEVINVGMQVRLAPDVLAGLIAERTRALNAFR
jgi:sugar phosphate isomerase/epimerase